MFESFRLGSRLGSGFVMSVEVEAGVLLRSEAESGAEDLGGGVIEVEGGSDEEGFDRFLSNLL